MADTCKNIESVLNNLSRKIDNQNRCCNDVKKQIGNLNQRLKNLENKVKRLESNNNNNKPNGLADILKRLARLESYCLSVEQAFSQLEKSITDIRTHTLGFLDFFSFIFK